uniref:transporter substrate-binding domain-containing protein n=1 Tax=Pararhizobium sp. IMCC3301 TaxID=3067904 RepID=UPI0027418183|nr:transporter substrate-binding domain-containing protein [Pararhizobium sp. IMCC3301]
MLKSITTKLAAFLVAVTALFAAAGAGTAQETSTWDAIKERGSLRIGVTQAPPWFYKELGADEWTGLGSSVGKAMAAELGVEFEPVEVTWGTAIAALQANKIDIMFVLDATPTRALAIDFPAQPLLYYALAVLADDDMKIETWADLNTDDMKLAVTQGTTMDTYVTKYLDKAEILRFPSNGESVAAFQSGRVKAVSLFHPPLIAMRKQIGRGQIVLPSPVRQSASSAGVRREADKTFRDWVSTAIAYYYSTGQTQVWYEDFLTEFGVDPSSVPAVRREEW